MPNYLYNPSESVRSLLIGLAKGTIVSEFYPDSADKGAIFDGFGMTVSNYGDAAAGFRVEIWDKTTAVWTQVAQSLEFYMEPGASRLCIFGNTPSGAEIPYDGPAWTFNPGGGGDGVYSFELKQNVGGTWVPDAILEKNIAVNAYITTEISGMAFRDASGNPVDKVSRGTGFVLVGTLRRIDNLAGISGRDIKIDYREATFIRPDWQMVATKATDTNGGFSANLTSPTPAGSGPWTFEYRCSFAGGQGLSASSASVGIGVSGLALVTGNVVLAVALPVVAGVLVLALLNLKGK